jgi:hypothetical protein
MTRSFHRVLFSPYGNFALSTDHHFTNLKIAPLFGFPPTPIQPRGVLAVRRFPQDFWSSILRFLKSRWI